MTAYFANGTEGELYREQVCNNCVNWRPLPGEAEETAGCRIMDLHFAWNYEQQADPVKRDALQHFIPMAGLYAGTCRMFVPRRHGAAFVQWAPGPCAEFRASLVPERCVTCHHLAAAHRKVTA